MAIHQEMAAKENMISVLTQEVQSARDGASAVERRRDQTNAHLAALAQAVEEMRAEISANREHIALLQARSLIQQPAHARSPSTSPRDDRAVPKRGARSDSNDGSAQNRVAKRASIAAIPLGAAARPFTRTPSMRSFTKPTVSVAPEFLGVGRSGAMSVPARVMRRASSAGIPSLKDPRFAASAPGLGSPAPGPGKAVTLVPAPGPSTDDLVGLAPATGALPTIAPGASPSPIVVAAAESRAPHQSTAISAAQRASGAADSTEAVESRRGSASVRESNSSLSVRFAPLGPAALYSTAGDRSSAPSPEFSRGAGAHRPPAEKARLWTNRRASTGDLMRGLMPDAPVHDTSILTRS